MLSLTSIINALNAGHTVVYNTVSSFTIFKINNGTFMCYWLVERDPNPIWDSCSMSIIDLSNDYKLSLRARGANYRIDDEAIKRINI